MSDFTPKTRLQKILCGVETTAKRRIEKAAAEAVANAGGGGGSAGPMLCEVTYAEDASTGAKTITLDKTAAEVFAAAQEGRCVQFSLAIGEMTVTGVIPMEVFHGTGNGTEIYTIKARADSKPTDVLFIGSNLAGTDTVVLTAVTGG